MRHIHGLIFQEIESDPSEWVPLAAEAALTLLSIVGMTVYFRRIWKQEQDRFHQQHAQPAQPQPP